MPDATSTLDPKDISANPENPRLIFRAAELEALEESISQQGILVPLTVYRDGRSHVILDGERRWRCAIKLGLRRVPVIVQDKPDKVQNIMMMFAIHKARKDWDPLPTAIKLKELEGLLTTRLGRRPSERVLAENASISVGEVRRLKKLFGLPTALKNELMEELEKEEADRKLRVDQVVEARGASQSLRKLAIITSEEEVSLTQALVDKFRAGLIRNTVDPRKLAKLGRAASRGEVPRAQALRAVRRLISEKGYTVEDAFEDTIAKGVFQRSLSNIAERLAEQLEEHGRRRYALSPELRDSLRRIRDRLQKLDL